MYDETWILIISDWKIRKDDFLAFFFNLFSPKKIKKNHKIFYNFSNNSKNTKKNWN
jgi:hypothetical protein